MDYHWLTRKCDGACEECDPGACRFEGPPDCAPGCHEIDPDNGGCRRCFAALGSATADGVPLDSKASDQPATKE